VNVSAPWIRRPVATAIGLVSVPVFLVLMLALAFVYLLPTPDVRA